MKGFVYILSNPSMPGIVKIGMTTRTVEGRAYELYQTGVPTPFKVEHSVLSPDCVTLEREVHGMLPDLRVGDGREFFRCSPSQAIDILDGAHLEQLRDWLGEFTETHILCEEPLAIDPGDACAICDRTADVSPYEISGALHLIDPEELQRAVEADRARLRRALDARLAIQAVAVQ